MPANDTMIAETTKGSPDLASLVVVVDGESDRELTLVTTTDAAASRSACSTFNITSSITNRHRLARLARLTQVLRMRAIAWLNFSTSPRQASRAV